MPFAQLTKSNAGAGDPPSASVAPSAPGVEPSAGPVASAPEKGEHAHMAVAKMSAAQGTATSTT